MTETHRMVVTRNDVSPELWKALTTESESSLVSRVLNFEREVRAELFGNLVDGVTGLLAEHEQENYVESHSIRRALLAVEPREARSAEGSRS